MPEEGSRGKDEERSKGDDKDKDEKEKLGGIKGHKEMEEEEKEIKYLCELIVSAGKENEAIRK